MTKIMIYGIGGKMGANVIGAIGATDATLVCGVDKFASPSDFKVPVYKCAKYVQEDVDVIIDFSRPDAIDDILGYALSRKCALVIATTGYSAEQLAKIEDASKTIPVFMASNFSLGINLLIMLARKAAKILGVNYDVEIIEQHHNTKVDAPSGTAATIADAISKEYEGGKVYEYGRHETNKRRDVSEIGIHSVRGGTVVGKHDVMFMGKDEVITIAHEASSRMVFAVGAVRAALFVAGCGAGMWGMDDLLAQD
ncbi:MAG: 4-hydroxy-tetrahydrodipicolinate reductase [Clostridia bacterium]|nr:4-hydroxy-tetrahydrodipicolinate reductase [Clostridia bacterium]